MPAFPELFPVAEGGRVGLVGDTHANTGWFIRVIEDLAAEGVRVVVHLGDFGWWPQYKFAQKISRAAGRIGVEVLFIDGNHEHHLNPRKGALSADPDLRQQAPRRRRLGPGNPSEPEIGPPQCSAIRRRSPARRHSATGRLSRRRRKCHLQPPPRTRTRPRRLP